MKLGVDHLLEDPVLRIPVCSLYGQVRRPTPEMLQGFDVVLVDLQDIGTRTYTFITTVGYMLEAAAQTGKGVWILDRPNPAGRQVEGTILEPGWESFIGHGSRGGVGDLSKRDFRATAKPHFIEWNLKSGSRQAA